MTENKKVIEGVQKAQAAIIKAGFPYIKFELEAHLFRDYNWSERKCQDFIDEFVGKDWMKKVIFRRFYNDGSVDSELTITLATCDAHEITRWMGAFNALAKAIGRGIRVDNAGLHIAIMGESHYPCNTRYLDPAKVANFSREVTKLLPALLFVSSHTYRTRGLNYRAPKISSDKYSVIAIHRGVFEYRLFDTCYDKPEAVYDKIEIIAATLKYYSARKNGAKLEKDIPVKSGGVIAQMFDRPEILEALETSLKYIKPSYKTIKELKVERGLTTDAVRFKRHQLKKEAELGTKLQSALSAWETRAKLELRNFKIEIKSLKGWKSLTQDDEKAMKFRLDNNFIPRKPTIEMLRLRLVTPSGGRQYTIRSRPENIYIPR